MTSQPSKETGILERELVVLWTFDLLPSSPVVPLSPSSPSSWMMIFALRRAAKGELILQRIALEVYHRGCEDTVQGKLLVLSFSCLK